MKVDEGFRAMYEREFTPVYRAAYMLCGDPSMAEDATQEAFARALVRWRRLGEQPWVGGWVTTTALNIARRQMRRRSPLRAQPTPVADPGADIDLVRGIRRLPRRQQEAIVLHYLHDMTVADTAIAIACGPGTVKTHLSRARVALAEALSDDESSNPRSRDRG